MGHARDTKQGATKRATRRTNGEPREWRDPALKPDKTDTLCPLTLATQQQPRALESTPKANRPWGTQ